MAAITDSPYKFPWYESIFFFSFYDYNNLEFKPYHLNDIPLGFKCFNIAATPPTTGWTLDFFYPNYTENQQSCERENSVRNARIYNKRMLYETRAFLASL